MKDQCNTPYASHSPLPGSDLTKGLLIPASGRDATVSKRGMLSDAEGAPTKKEWGRVQPEAQCDFLLTDCLPKRRSMPLPVSIRSKCVDFIGTATPARTGDPQIHNLVL
jgi:hypothetical protein